jgi:hypothetical protein
MDEARTGRPPVVRALRLHRRHSRAPWIYLLYHRDPDELAAQRSARRCTTVNVFSVGRRRFLAESREPVAESGPEFLLDSREFRD